METVSAEDWLRKPGNCFLWDTSSSATPEVAWYYWNGILFCFSRQPDTIALWLGASDSPRISRSNWGLPLHFFLRWFRWGVCCPSAEVLELPLIYLVPFHSAVMNLAGNRETQVRLRSSHEGLCRFYIGSDNYWKVARNLQQLCSPRWWGKPAVECLNCCKPLEYRSETLSLKTSYSYLLRPLSVVADNTSR